jgi:hypothetical protein
MRQATQIEARLLEEVGAGRHKGSRSRTMAELLERWLEWRPTVRPIAPTTISSYRVAVAPPTLVGYLTAGATPVWLLGSFAVLSLLYRADQAPTAAEPSAEQAPASAAVAPNNAQTPPTGAEVLTKRAQAERAYAHLSATGAPVSAGQLAVAAGLSASYARALVAEFHARPPARHDNHGRPAAERILLEANEAAS